MNMTILLTLCLAATAYSFSTCNRMASPTIAVVRWGWLYLTLFGKKDIECGPAEKSVFL